MKTKSSITTLIMAFALFIPMLLNAQPGGGIPGLTEEQKAKISDLRLKHQKEMQLLKNQIGENRAHFHTLMTVDKPDMDLINKNIDEFGKIRIEMMKKNAAFHQSVRSMLTYEQKLAFDAKAGKKGMKHGMAGMEPGKGMGRHDMNQKGCMHGRSCCKEMNTEK